MAWKTVPADLAVEVLKYSLAFFLGLFLNRAVERRRDRRTFDRVMLAALRAEARGNELVLHESFLPLFEGGIVLREFGIDSATRYLAEPKFLEQCDTRTVDLLVSYIRELRHANTYRDFARGIRLDGDGKDWERAMVERWRENLKRCETVIAEVSALGSSKT